MNLRRPWSILLLFLLAWPFVSRAAILPSFRLEASTWMATDIVLVTETGQPAGRAQVLETWKGGLPAGETIVVPGLKEFTSETSRTVNTRDLFEQKDTGPPVHVTGRRLVLFLVRSGGTKSDWQPATFWRELRVAAVWLEGDKAYSFLQLSNPGASELRELSKSPTALKAEVDRIIGVQQSLSQIARLPDRTERARTLSAYADTEYWEARQTVFLELKECGLAALPTLRSMLQDDKLRAHQDLIVEAMGGAGGQAVGEELTQDLFAETDFWKRTAPSLQVGWWNGKGLDDWPKVEALRDRYTTTLALLRALKKMGYRGDLSSVLELRCYWNSLPQLCDKSGLDQMIQECDGLLHPAVEAER